MMLRQVDKEFGGLVKADFLSLMSNVNIDACERTKQHLLASRVLAHAQNGHGVFSGIVKGKKRLPSSVYPLASLDHVYDALDSCFGGFSPSSQKRWAQSKIDGVFRFFERLSLGENPEFYHDEVGEPLFGYGWFKGRRIKNHNSALIGGYLSAVMDSYEPWRVRLKEEHGITMGGGICVPVDLERLVDYNLSIEHLENYAHDLATIDFFRDVGIIPACPAKTGFTVINGYVRREVGQGSHDNLAALSAGMLYGEDALEALVLVDGVDFWEKTAEYAYDGGQDGRIGDLIKANEGVRRAVVPSFSLPSERQVLAWMKPLAVSLYPAENPKFSGKLPHSSQSYFYQKQKGHTVVSATLDYILKNRSQSVDITHPYLSVKTQWLFGRFFEYLESECFGLYEELFPGKLAKFLRR